MDGFGYFGGVDEYFCGDVFDIEVGVVEGVLFVDCCLFVGIVFVENVVV